MEEENKEVEQPKEETVVNEEEKAPLQEEKVELSSEEIQRNNKKSTTILVILLCISVIVIIILLCLLLLGNNSKNNNNTNTNNNGNENTNTNVDINYNDDNTDTDINDNSDENQDSEPDTNVDDGMDHFDLKVENLNSSKEYHIQLVKKEDKKADYSDGYSYAYYDKDSKEYITGFDYINQTCNNSCSDPDYDWCIEKESKVYSYSLNNKDYLYVYAKTNNVCGGYEGEGFIYDVKAKKIEKIENATNSLIKEDNSFVIELSGAGDDIFAPGSYYSLSGLGVKGFIFITANGNKTVTGRVVMSNNSIYIVVDNKETAKTIKTYDSMGNLINTFEDIVAFDEERFVTYGENGMFVYDMNHYQLGEIEFEKYTEDKYVFDPYLKVENNKLVVKCYTWNEDIGNYELYKTLYFDLNN